MATAIRPGRDRGVVFELARRSDIDDYEKVHHGLVRDAVESPAITSGSNRRPGTTPRMAAISTSSLCRHRFNLSPFRARSVFLATKR